MDDLADPALVSAKEAFVRAHFLGALEDEDALNEQLQLHAKVLSEERLEINGRPLEIWMEAVSRNGQWLIKVQSSQDGHESDKTKELAGRCRALRLAWSHRVAPRNRAEWLFYLRPLPKLALVLDGDWDATKKRNLYEAGWDWVGDVSQLQELHQRIQSS